jgi:hypothetical protein
VDVIYPHGVRGANRMVVDVMSYRQRRGGRTVSPSLVKINFDSEAHLHNIPTKSQTKKEQRV